MNEYSTLEADAQTVKAFEQVTAKYNEHSKTPLTPVQALRRFVLGHPLVSQPVKVLTYGVPVVAPA